MAGKGALSGLPAALDASFVGVLSNTFEASQGASQDDDSMLEGEQSLHGGSRKRGRGGASSSAGGQADYAMRHQAAEQRRRARINERLDALRKLVPHDPRANTASFLEDVIKYILALKDTNEKLEQALLASHPGAQNMAAAANTAATSSRNPKPQHPAPAGAAAAQPLLPSAGAGSSSAPAAVPSAQSPGSANSLQASLVQAQVQSLQQLLTIQAAQGVMPQTGAAGMQPAREADAAGLQAALMALQQKGANQEQLRNLLASGQLAALSGVLPSTAPLVLTNDTALPALGESLLPALKAER